MMPFMNVPGTAASAPWDVTAPAALVSLSEVASVEAVAAVMVAAEPVAVVVKTNPPLIES
jgi:hypothetical protein